MCVFHKETNHLANTIQIACIFCDKEVPYVGIHYNYYLITCINYLDAQVGAEIHIQSLYVANICMRYMNHTPPPEPNKFDCMCMQAWASAGAGKVGHWPPSGKSLHGKYKMNKIT